MRLSEQDIAEITSKPHGPRLRQNHLAPALAKVRKYRNEPVERLGRRFDSRKEANRADELVILQKAGAISGLTYQVPFTFEYHGIKLCKYVADFCYIEKDKLVVEDCKGFRTRMYQLKKRMMLAWFGIEIRET